MESQSFTPIADAKSKKLFFSNDNLARQLIAAFSSLEWPSARSLGTKIGEIDRGSRAWWLHRPHLSSALAEHLGLSLSDLGLAAPRNEKLFVFNEFPELPPLRLGHEKPCPIAEVFDERGTKSEMVLASWLVGYPSNLTRDPSPGVTWIEVPRGTGLSLLCAQLVASGRFEFRSANSLHELSLYFRQPEPLAINLESKLDEKDLIALAAANPEKAILIAASFPAPLDKDLGGHLFTHWDFQVAKSTKRRQLMLTSNSLFGGIERMQWRLSDNWQDRLLDWVETRLQSNNVDTLFTAEGLKRWLRKFQTIQSDLYTPKILLALCRFCHNSPETHLPSSADPNAGSKLMKNLLNADAEQTHLASTLIANHFRNRSNHWGEPLGMVQWATLNPGSFSAPTGEELRAIASAGNLVAREQAAKSLEAKLQSRRLEILLDCGLLNITIDGKYLLQPQFLVDIVARDYMISLACNEPAKEWALFCFDPVRRTIIDAALSLLSFNQLTSIGKSISELPADNLLAKGLCETLFVAITAKVDNVFCWPQELHHLSERITTQLVLQNFQPISRSLDTINDQLQWQASCWAWSLMTKAPRGCTEQIRWLIPGWFQNLYGDPSIFLVDTTQTKDADFSALSPAWIRMLEVAERWVATLEQAPAQTPQFLAPLLLREASLGKWPIQQRWWQELLNQDWAPEYLMQSTPSSAHSWPVALLPSLILYALERQSMKDSLWDLMIIFRSGIFQWLLSNIEEEQFLDCLGSPEIKFLLDVPMSLPPNLRRQLLRPKLIKEHISWRQISSVTKAIDEPEVLLELLGTLPNASIRLWDLAPHQAENVLKNPQLYSLENVDLVKLIEACPANYLGTAIEHLMESPTLVDREELFKWIAEKLQTAGSESEALLKLAHHCLPANV